MRDTTLALIKPDITVHRPSVCGEIIQRIAEESFKVLQISIERPSLSFMQDFYNEHAQRPFYDDLCRFMVSGPLWVMALKREEAISHWRTVMGATNPAEAASKTIRKLYGSSIDHNAVHGSDSSESAQRELRFFFSYRQLHSIA